MKLSRLSLGAACALSLAAPAVHAAYHPAGPERDAIAKLITDLQSIKAGSQVTDAEKEALAADFKLLSASTTKPSQASLDQLAADFADALASAAASGTISATEKADIVLDIDAVFNSAGLSTDQAAQFISDARALLVSSGVTAPDVEEIANDLTGIAANLQTSFLFSDATFPFTPGAGVKASGHAELTASLKDGGVSSSALTIETLGLTTGAYTVSATVGAGAAPIPLGTLKVSGRAGRPGIGAVMFGGASSNPFPTGFDSGDLVSVTIADASGAVQFTGAVADATTLTRLGDFRLIPGPAAPDALGNAAFKVTTKAASKDTHFLLYAWKLPVSAPLTLKINGTAVGTVTTNDKGRLLLDAGKIVLPVKADGHTPLLTPTPLPADADLSTLTFLELDDATGQVVATAGFSS